MYLDGLALAKKETRRLFETGGTRACIGEL